MNAKPKANAAFLPLFSMELRHQYFSGGAYGSYAVRALGATQKVMQRLGWVAAQKESKFTLYADGSRAAAVLKQQEDGLLDAPDLCFALEFRDPDFARYTDLPMRAGEAVSFVGGLAKPHVLAKTMILAEDLVPVQARPFQIPVSATGDLWLVNLSEEKLQQLPPPVRGMIRIDPTSLDIGQYCIWAQKKTIYRFIATHDTFTLTSFFYLSIPLAKMFSALRHLSKNEEYSQQVLPSDASSEVLILPTRQTLWHYDFFNHGGENANHFTIKSAIQGRHPTDSSESPVFKQMKGVVGPSGETSIRFQSLNPIPLTVNPLERLTLLHNGRPLIDQLPTPGLDFCQADGSDDLCSNLFVYL
jgi:hypothetical protein